MTKDRSIRIEAFALTSFIKLTPSTRRSIVNGQCNVIRGAVRYGAPPCVQRRTGLTGLHERALASHRTTRHDTPLHHLRIGPRCRNNAPTLYAARCPPLSLLPPRRYNAARTVACWRVAMSALCSLAPRPTPESMPLPAPPNPRAIFGVRSQRSNVNVARSCLFLTRGRTCRVTERRPHSAQRCSPLSLRRNEPAPGEADATVGRLTGWRERFRRACIHDSPVQSRGEVLGLLCRVDICGSCAYKGTTTSPA